MRPSNSLESPEPQSPVPKPHIVAEGELIEAELIEDWETEVRYEVLVPLPKVRATIERHAAQSAAAPLERNSCSSPKS